MWSRLCSSLVIAGEVFFFHFGKRNLMFDFHGGEVVLGWMRGRGGQVSWRLVGSVVEKLFYVRI